MDKPDAKEVAVSFGDHSQLTGVYSPACVISLESSPQTPPCALFLTAGLLHHVGPTRLHVELARSLSSQGVAGLRFDLSGVGESEASSAGADFKDRSVIEIQAAMDYLQHEYQHTRFVVIGLCSGADDGLAAVQRDQRIVGMVQLNGYAYKAGWFMLHRVLNFYLPRVLVKDKLLRLVRKQLARLMPKWATNQVSSSMLPSPTDNASADGVARLTAEERQSLQDLDSDYRYIPPQSDTQDILGTLCREAVDMLFIYTGSEHDDYTYHTQFYAMYPKLIGSEHIRVEYLKAADHTLMLEEDRMVVSQWVTQWYEAGAFERKDALN